MGLLYLNIHPNVSCEKTTEIIESAEYFSRITTNLGGVVVSHELEPSLGLKDIISENPSKQLPAVIEFNSYGNRKDNIHMFVSDGEVFTGSISGLAVGNIAVVSTVSLSKDGVYQPVIHELGHLMGLVQSGMPNYYIDSVESAGGRPSNHCAIATCIMCVRPLEPGVQLWRYAHFSDTSGSTFCVDCKDHLGLVKLEELPWYNKV